MNVKRFPLSSQEKKQVESILVKAGKAKEKRDIRLITFGALGKLLTGSERTLIARLRSTNPATLGFKGRFFGIRKVPTDLVALRRQTYQLDGKAKKIETQYLPPAPYAAFKKLQQALRKETGTILFAGSGYRSPAYQLVVFLWNVRREHFNVAKVATKVALPGYSEHGNPKRQAIDFTLAKESSKKNKTTMFSNSREYRWLIKNANRFHFYES
ncbi:MAG TPA: D-alanyl-D-alanine carboxypeptidase family protein, partial [Candidatus Paceibacterota bacterium]|nr:D-alanyl-D-alanine carboxypeptidase family protein [Candidatus Paceibacterota bacterium]